MGREKVTSTRWVRGRVARGAVAIGTTLFTIVWAMAFLKGLTSPQAGGPDPKLMVFAFVGWSMAALGYSFLGAFERLSLARMIQDLPTARIRSAQQGYVELYGVARSGGTTLNCPLCRMSCLWWVYTTDKGRKTHTPEKAPDFILEDPTGRVWVKPNGAEVFSARRGEHHKGSHQHICVGDPLYALGEFRTQLPPRGKQIESSPKDATLKQREEALHRKLLAIKYDARKMALFDTNRDGKLDEREVEALTKVAKMQADRDVGSAALPPPESVLGEPVTEADRLPFVLVVGSEREATKAVRRDFGERAVFAVVAGVAGFTMILLALSDLERRPDRAARNAAKSLSAKPVAAEAAPTRATKARREKSPERQAYDLFVAKKYDEAIAAYDALIEQSPDNGELYGRRAWAHGRAGHDELARADIETGCELGDAISCKKLEELKQED